MFGDELFEEGDVPRLGVARRAGDGVGGEGAAQAVDVLAHDDGHVGGDPGRGLAGRCAGFAVRGHHDADGRHAAGDHRHAALSCTGPAREFAAGMAEVIKYGLIRDRPFLDWLDANMAAINNREPDVLIEVIRCSCANKAEVVAADEREAGQRALLNLGHTYGHALEAELGYGEWLHGEAVAAGMCMAADTARRLGWLDDDQCEHIERIISAAHLPVAPPRELECARIRSLMARDKKVAAGTLRLVLMRDIGEAVVTRDYGDALDATLKRYFAE